MKKEEKRAGEEESKGTNSAGRKMWNKTNNINKTCYKIPGNI